MWFWTRLPTLLFIILIKLAERLNALFFILYSYCEEMVQNTSLSQPGDKTQQRSKICFYFSKQKSVD